MEVKESCKKSAKIEKIGFLITKRHESALKTEGIPTVTKWCLDSGCTSHMCTDKTKFVHSEKCESEKLSLASRATANIESRGMVKLLVTECSQVRSLKFGVWKWPVSLDFLEPTNYVLR